MVLKDDRQFYAFQRLEDVRSSLKSNKHKIDLEDYGSGSSIHRSKTRSISDIASSALSLPYQCRVLFRLVEYFRPKEILELGTSLGLSAAYMASANKASNITTLEGDSNILSIAQQVHHGLNLDNINTILGPFNQTLNATLAQIPQVDLAFIDGHHEKEATLRYYDAISPHLHKDSLVIIDDIYWSKGMNEAWQELHMRQEVTLSLDLHFCGILFFRVENLIKEHHLIRPDSLFYFLK